jgi:hypothetical protein
MILEALSCLTDEMNDFFRLKVKTSEDKVVLSGLVGQDGSIAIQGENKIVITLINVEKEINGNSASPSLAGTAAGNRSPAVNINLSVLFSAYFAGNNYAEALRFLSFTIGFFQHKNVFTSSNTPRLDTRIDKLTFELFTATLDQINNTWAALGAKYLPSVIYKVRMLTIDESVVNGYVPVIKAISSQNNIL